MLRATTVSVNGNYEKHFTTTVFDKKVHKMAKELFDEYQINGVILNDSFSDNIWRFSNQLQNMTISFQ